MLTRKITRMHTQKQKTLFSKKKHTQKQLGTTKIQGKKQTPVHYVNNGNQEQNTQ